MTLLFESCQRMTKKSPQAPFRLRSAPQPMPYSLPAPSRSSRMRANLYVPSTGTPVYAVANAVNAPPTTFTVPADSRHVGSPSVNGSV